MPIAKKDKHFNTPITKDIHLNMPITDSNILMSQSQQLHICMTQFCNTALQKRGKHDNYSNLVIRV